MTKKIRLMDDEPTTPTPVQEPEVSSVSIDPAKDMTIKQVMKYLEAIDWKLWEIYNIIKSYVENPSVPQPSQPQANATDVATELAKLLGNNESEKKSVVKKLFG